MKRIWIEQKVKDTDEILEVQKILINSIPVFRTYDKDKLHLTVFHVGVPDNLYEELDKFVPNLSYENYIDMLFALLKPFVELLPRETVLKADSLVLLGNPKTPKIGIKLIKSSTLKRARERVIYGLEHFLLQLGVTDPQAFILNNKNLGKSYNKDYIPHITLGTMLVPEDPPKICLGEKLFHFEPSYIVNFDQLKLG